MNIYEKNLSLSRTKRKKLKLSNSISVTFSTSICFLFLLDIIDGPEKKKEEYFFDKKIKSKI